MRTAKLAHQSPDGLAHRPGHEVELTVSVTGMEMAVVPVDEMAGFDPSTEVKSAL
jgi:hypothetical protein